MLNSIFNQEERTEAPKRPAVPVAHGPNVNTKRQNISEKTGLKGRTYRKKACKRDL